LQVLDLFEADSNRVAAFIVDIQIADQILVLVEPLFSGMGAHVELHPVMSLVDLKKGIPQAVIEVNSYRDKNDHFFIIQFLIVTKNKTKIEVGRTPIIKIITTVNFIM
jgi:hypothetical protein